MKAVLHHPISEQLERHLTEISPPWLELTVIPEIAEASGSGAVREAEVLFHVLHPVSTVLMDSAPALKLVQKVGVGVDAIDLPAAAARGIRIANMPGTNTRAVAEMTLGLMLAVLRRITLLDQATKEGRGWQAWDATEFGEIAGRTVGLIGYGAIPRSLAPVLRALGGRVLYHSRTPASEAPESWRPMSALLAEADIVSLHLPLAPQTRSIIDAAALAAMKPGAILINTSRGGLIDESALFAALNSGRLRGAGLDVHAREPVSHPDPLLELDGVVVTPHLAWLTWETWTRSWRVAMDNCERLREGRPLLHQIEL